MFINQVIAQVNNKKSARAATKKLSARPHIKNAVRVPCNKQNKGRSRHEPTRHQSRAPTTRRHITAMPPNPRGKRRTAHSPILLTEGAINSPSKKAGSRTRKRIGRSSGSPISDPETPSHPPHRETEERGNGIMPGTAAAPAPESDTGAGGDQSAHSCGTVRDSHPVPF